MELDPLQVAKKLALSFSLLLVMPWASQQRQLYVVGADYKKTMDSVQSWIIGIRDYC